MHAYKPSTIKDEIKDEKLNYSIPLDLRKRFSKTRENFGSDSQLNMIQ